MSDAIEFDLSNRQVKFRVVTIDPWGKKVMLFSSDFYDQAEKFCWNYSGGAYEIWIEKVWIKKAVQS